MRAAGHELGGIRLDSGDLAYLSHEARRMLDEAGFPEARIVASNDLDAETIASLREQGAAIDTWGVGTRLVTAYEQPALGGVYKLTALRSSPDAAWRPTVKVSADPAKTTVPGILGVRRFFDHEGYAAADMIYDTLDQRAPGAVLVDPTNAFRRKPLDPKWRREDLLAPVMRAGDLVAELPDLAAIREHARQELASFHPSILRRLNPHRYPAGLELELHLRREALVASARDGTEFRGGRGVTT
jgi:nicotinate phosphoribosyltransferase